MSTADLPIHEVLPDLTGALERQRGAVLVAPTGAGKTTQVPQAILDAGLVDDDQRILVMEPRRVAARATAKRIAEERDVSIGGEVGYQVRFDRQIGPETRIAVVTEGIVTRRLQDDPFLEGVGAVVMDEFHERSTRADLAIAFLEELREVRDDLHLCVMSATIAAEPIADYLDVPVVESEGRTYPVDIHYRETPSDDDAAEQVARAVRRALEAEDDDGGDILAFLPGAGSIHRTIEILETMDVVEGLEIRPLYGALPPEEQDEAIESSDRRKIVVSTNIAETSLTIEGVTTVIDSGLVKQMEMSPASGLDRLVTTDVSLDSAEQRAGRAGRTRPGRAFRLWTHAHEYRMPQQQKAEILRVDITGPVLEVLAWSGSDPKDFNWFEAPPEHAIDRAVELLRHLGAIVDDGFRLTDLGRRMLELPTHPRIARMLIEGAERGVLHRVAGMAAVLSERDFLLSMDRDAPSGACDLQRRVEVLDEVARGRTRNAASLGMEVHVGRARRVQKVRGQLAGMLEARGEPDDDPEAEARKAVAAGFPDRICMSRESGRHYVMTGGEPLALAYESIVRDPEFLIASTIAGETRGGDTGGVGSRGLIRQASRFEPEWLEAMFADRLDTSIEVAFDEDRERVTARRRRTFDDLTLDEETASVEEAADPAEVTEILVDAALEDLGSAFGLSDEEEQFLNRIESLRRWRPELDLPAIDPEEGEPERLREILEQICWGKRSFGELRHIGLKGRLKQYLSHEHIRALREYAPESVDVPSGRTIPLEYEPGKAPVLEVRIQEMFGTSSGPTIAGGEVPLTLHLLAPNFRVAQITDDLEGFWEHTYPEVRKEMRARYPKHPWPDDPREAEPVAM
jgi:ATP-dependent helicase HrpB